MRRAPSLPDRRPPAPRPAVPCVTCGQGVGEDERADGLLPRHVVCDPMVRGALARRLEASRAVHRANHALSSLPAMRERLRRPLAELPDACDVHDALSFLATARTLVECSPEISTHQRRIALSLLTATERKLGG